MPTQKLFEIFFSMALLSITMAAITFFSSAKGQKKSKQFFQAGNSSKKRTNEFYFITTKPQVNLSTFVFWRKLKTPKRLFEINWPLVWRSCTKFTDFFYNLKLRVTKLTKHYVTTLTLILATWIFKKWCQSFFAQTLKDPQEARSNLGGFKSTMAYFNFVNFKFQVLEICPVSLIWHPIVSIFV